MKNKIIAVGLLIGMSVSNIAFAASLQADKTTVQSKSPLYVMVKLGMDGLCSEKLMPGNEIQGCLLSQQLSENSELSGSIEAVQGKMTLAKELYIGSDETIKNAKGDLGLPTSKIDFSFKTPFYKGVIIKITPDLDFVENGLPEDVGRLIFSVNNDGKIEKKLEINYSDLFGGGNMKWSENPYGMGFQVKVINFDSGSSLTERNEVFRNKLAVATKLQFVESWARNSLVTGKINADLYKNVDKLVESAWFENFSNDDLLVFQRYYPRLLNNIRKDKVTPALFYGGLNQLMKRITK